MLDVIYSLFCHEVHIDGIIQHKVAVNKLHCLRQWCLVNWECFSMLNSSCGHGFYQFGVCIYYCINAVSLISMIQYILCASGIWTDSKVVVGLKANMVDDKYRNVSQSFKPPYQTVCKCFHSRYSRMASMLVLSLTLSLLWGMITLPLQMKHRIQFR